MYLSMYLSIYPSIYLSILFNSSSSPSLSRACHLSVGAAASNLSRQPRGPLARHAALAEEVLTGRNETIDFEDFLGKDGADAVSVCPHAFMAQQYGL